MASKNVVVQSSKKATRSTSQGSTIVNAASGGVTTRSIAQAAASSTREQAIVTATCKSCKVPNGHSKITDGVTQIASDALKQKSLGALCVQKNEEGKEIALYYLSHTLVGAKLKYSPIEKICLSLIFAIQKLRHYMQAYTVQMISQADPIKHILSRLILNG